MYGIKSVTSNSEYLENKYMASASEEPFESEENIHIYDSFIIPSGKFHIEKIIF